MAVDQQCVFCKIVAGDLPCVAVHEDLTTLAFMDINPATRGHALVIPRCHARDLLDVSIEDLAACVGVARDLAARCRERLGADGVNLFVASGRAAWQTVFHFHVHVIPRYRGDALRRPWTPTPEASSEIEAAARDLAGGG